MHSRYARNLYDPKIKRIFEIAWALFEIILFIRFEIAWTGPDKSEFFFGIKYLNKPWLFFWQKRINVTFETFSVGKQG